METEIKSYSDAVKKSNNNSLSKPENLKKLVKQVVQLEDKTKNVMIFGIEESNQEDLSEKVSNIFKEMQQKPHFVASRVGKKSPSNRPVKVLLKTSAAAHEILKKSTILRGVDQFRNV